MIIDQINQQFRFMKNLLLFLMVIPGSIFAQSSTRTEIDYSWWSSGMIYDMGNKGVVIMGGTHPYASSSRSFSLPQTGSIVRIDTNGKVLWNKNIPIPSEKKSIGKFFGTSSDGNDVYVLSFEKRSEKNGYTGAILTHVDINGIAKSKRYDDHPETFGFVLMLYANSKYLFVMTSTYNYYDYKHEPNENQYQLYRFDKNTLEMKLLDDDLEKVNPTFTSAWQMIRVTDAGVTAYRVLASQDQTTTIELASFDNDGKKISYVSNDIKFTAFPRKTFCRPNYPAGICRGDFTLNISVTGTQGMYETVQEPEGWCNMIYDDMNDRYLAYGMIGPEQQKNTTSDMIAENLFTGFFVQEFSADFKPGKKVENTNLPDLLADKKIRHDNDIHERKLGFHLNPNGILLVNIHSHNGGKHIYTVDATTFAIKNHATGSDPHSIYSSAPGVRLSDLSEVQKYDEAYPRDRNEAFATAKYDSDPYIFPYSYDTRYGQFLLYQDKVTYKLTCFWSGEMGE